jgi:adenosine deaminase
MRGHGPEPATTSARDVARLPKAHLHVHVESAIRWPTLREIGAANGTTVPDGPGDGGVGFTGFRQFADHGALIRNCLRRPEDFTRIGLEFCEDEVREGTGYAEVTFTAASHGQRLGDLDMPLAALLRGLAAGKAAYGIEYGVILDHSRRRSVGRAWRTLELAVRYAADGVVGIGMAGDESFPLRPFVEVFEAARQAGLHLVHHAGESAGPESIREAVVAGQAERLGHGIRILEDGDLVTEVRERAIPLEVCPSSNIALGFTPAWDGHPLDRLRAAGLAISVNTDIPAVIGTTLAEEYRRVQTTFGYDDTILAALAQASIDASFATPATQARLGERVAAWLAMPG